MTKTSPRSKVRSTKVSKEVHKQALKDLKEADENNGTMSLEDDEPADEPADEKQTRIEGTHDPVPDELAAKVSQYVGSLRRRQKEQTKEDGLRGEVIELMHEHDVHQVELDDEKVLVLERGNEKIKIKKRGE